MKIINQNDIDRIVEPKKMVEVVAKAFDIYGKGAFSMRNGMDLKQAE